MEKTGKLLLAVFVVLGLLGCRIEGVITTNGNEALPGVTVDLSGDENDTAVTDEQGRYAFNDLSGTNYTVTPILEGYIFSPESQDVTFTKNNQSVAGVDFIAEKMLEPSIALGSEHSLALKKDGTV
ncbi:MAG: carboxypeptidase-like regulatory domain-containing protein, partial [Desulfobacteraceae bacterium]